MTRVLVADDHDVVRRGVRSLLESHAGLEVCGEAPDGRQALELAVRLKPDVVVLDIGMPELNGLEAARRIAAACPGTEILILTMHDSEEMVREVIGAGARGCVLKSDAGRSLIAAVEALSRHEPYLTSRVSEIVIEGFKRSAGDGPRAAGAGARLTSREREVLQLVAEGRSGKEVATRLGISVKTAETHRANLMRKLGAHSVVELVRYAIRNRLVES